MILQGIARLQKARKTYFSNYQPSISLVLLLIANSLCYAANNPTAFNPPKKANTTFFVDTDGDGVDDTVDLDDDNDGILDIDENCLQVESYIRNYDFEEYSQLPDNISQVDRLDYWKQATEATSDFFHQDAWNGVLDYVAPPTPSGKGYVGGSTFPGLIEVESVGTNLYGKLEAGITYELNILLGSTKVGFYSTLWDDGYGGEYDGNFVLYGYTTPQNFPLPFINSVRLSDPNAIELIKEKIIIPEFTWGEYHFTFTPTQDIYAIIISSETDYGIEVNRGDQVFYDRILLREACNATSDFDTDGDGIVNRLDLDSDNDGISDLEESGLDIALFDSNQNGVIDGLDFTDTNGNGLADSIESVYGNATGVVTKKTDQDIYPNFLDLDSDADGIPDTVEAFPTIGYINNDGDVSDEDADGDGIISQFDSNDSTTLDFGGSFTSPQNTDAILSTNPDTLPDYIDTDSDGDGILDFVEGGDAVIDVSYQDPNGSINNPLTDLMDYILGNNEAAYRESCIPDLSTITSIFVCGDAYVLPDLPTTEANYYTQAAGSGTLLNAGDTISVTTTPTTVYVYAVNSNSASCTNEISFTITQQEAPVLDTIANAVQCDAYILPNMSGTNLSANARYYTQPNGQGAVFESGSVIAYPDFANYPVVLYAYELNGDCSDEQPFELTLFQTPNLDVIAHVEICDSYTLPEPTGANLTDNVAYFTETNGRGDSYGVGDVINFTDFDAYPVTLYAYDTNGSVPCASEQAFVLTIYQSPTLDPMAAVVACESYTLPELSGTNLNPTATYFTQTGGAGDSYASGAVISYADFNTYPITLFAHDANEICSTEQSFSINILAPILLPTPRLNTLNCEEGTMTNSVEVRLASNQITGGSGSYSRFQFVWDNNTPKNTADDIILQDGSETTYLETDPSEKRIVINVYDSENCSASTEIIIPARTALTAEITSSQQNVCSNENDGNIAIAFSGGYPPYTVKLQNEFGRNTIIETTRENEYTFNFLAGGFGYDISITDSKNCSITLAQALAPAVDLSAAIEIAYFCPEGAAITQNEVNIILEQDLANEVIFTLDGDESTAQLSPIFNNVAAGEHTLEIAHENGCVNNRLRFSIQSILPIELSLTTPEINTIKAAAMGGGSNYQYSFNGQAFGRNTTFVIFETGTYSVTARDANNCEATQEVFLEFLPIIIPDHFTPNDDSGWKPLNMEGYPNATISIYDRNGRKITQLKVNEEWHGFYQSSDLPSGDYWYVIRLNSPVNRQELIGHFTMIR